MVKIELVCYCEIQYINYATKGKSCILGQNDQIVNNYLFAKKNYADTILIQSVNPINIQNIIPYLNLLQSIHRSKKFDELLAKKLL